MICVISRFISHSVQNVACFFKFVFSDCDCVDVFTFRVACMYSSSLTHMLPVACVCYLWPSLSPSALAGSMVRDYCLKIFTTQCENIIFHLSARSLMFYISLAARLHLNFNHICDLRHD